MCSSPELHGLSRIAVFVEDPGAVNFLGPLVDRLLGYGMFTVVLGIGVGARMIRERHHEVLPPPHPSQTAEFIRLYRPTVLVVGTSENPNTPAFALVDAAHAAQVSTVGVVDASVNAEFRFRGSGENPLAHVPDWLIVPDESTASAFEALGLPRDRVRLIENPARNLARRRGWLMRDRNLINNDSLRSRGRQLRVIFIAELSEGLVRGAYRSSPDYRLKGRGRSSARTEVVIEEFLDACFELRRCARLQITLVLRLHPKQGRNDLGALCEEFDEVSTGGDPLDLVATADLVVGMTSMLLVQAYDIGVPCLSILPRESEKGWVPEVASGCIPSVTTRAELLPAIEQLLTVSQAVETRRQVSPSNVDPVSEMIEFLAHAASARRPL